jgi:hypothetical protein
LDLLADFTFECLLDEWLHDDAEGIAPVRYDERVIVWFGGYSCAVGAALRSVGLVRVEPEWNVVIGKE